SAQLQNLGPAFTESPSLRIQAPIGRKNWYRAFTTHPTVSELRRDALRPAGAIGRSISAMSPCFGGNASDHVAVLLAPQQGEAAFGATGRVCLGPRSSKR